MSNHLATYESLNLGSGRTSMHVGAFGAFGGVQFTLADGGYCALNEAQVRHLVKTLQHRLKCELGYASTDDDRDEWVPTGKQGGDAR